MASSKKSTSKTARVMNLLSKSREEPPVVEQPSVPVPAPAVPEIEGTSVQPVAEAVTPVTPAPVSAPPAHSTHTPPLISSMQADSVISNQVMSALENALDEELGTAQQETPTVPVPPTPPVEEPVAEIAPPVEEILEPTPVVEISAAEPNIEPAPAPVVETVPEAAPKTEVITQTVSTATVEYASGSGEKTAPTTQFTVDSGATYVNVMETLVEEKANKYINLFGLCKCQRCVADVKAYALNHLSPKYVVMRTGEVIPRITLYENQFSAEVTAQILNACKIVMASPRHDS